MTWIIRSIIGLTFCTGFQQKKTKPMQRKYMKTKEKTKPMQRTHLKTKELKTKKIY